MMMKTLFLLLTLGTRHKPANRKPYYIIVILCINLPGNEWIHKDSSGTGKSNACNHCLHIWILKFIYWHLLFVAWNLFVFWSAVADCYLEFPSGIGACYLEFNGSLFLVFTGMIK
jgi:hypothetical protein